MHNPTSLLAATLLLASSLVQAETRNTHDLTYCLALPTAPLIAKCSGELSPGGKGRTFTQAEVDKIMSEQKISEPAPAPAPVITIMQPAASAPTGAPPANTAPPEQVPGK